jgi:16S rRNA processing protein RimM
VIDVYNPHNPEALLKLTPVWLTDSGSQARPVSLTGRVTRLGLIIKIRQITTRTQAQELAGQELAVDRRTLPPLEEDEFYHTDLLGLEACLTTGELLGRVVNLLDQGGQNLTLVIKNEAGLENLVPFSEEQVPEVLLEEGRLLIAPCPGLLTLPPDSP